MEVFKPASRIRGYLDDGFNTALSPHGNSEVCGFAPCYPGIYKVAHESGGDSGIDIDAEWDEWLAASDVVDLEQYIARLQNPEIANVAINILHRIVEVTTSIFGDDVKISESFDPEFPEDKNIVLSVETDWPTDRVIQAEQEWAKAIGNISPTLETIRLSILPK